ncbi:MAG: high-potential iron-sulfur protein [Pseudomonadota bacterium]
MTQQAKSRGVSRRQILRSGAIAVAAVPLAAIGVRGAQAETVELPKLTADDPAAKALGYVDNVASIAEGSEATFKAGSDCANCQLYTGGDAEYGPCSIFPGKLVSAKGWCRTWVQKAG